MEEKGFPQQQRTPLAVGLGAAAMAIAGLFLASKFRKNNRLAEEASRLQAKLESEKLTNPFKRN